MRLCVSYSGIEYSDRVSFCGDDGVETMFVGSEITLDEAKAATHLCEVVPVWMHALRNEKHCAAFAQITRTPLRNVASSLKLELRHGYSEVLCELNAVAT